MEGKHDEWFKSKFVNPRTNEGEPQTERLEYFREFFKFIGDRDPRFSGAVILGSTLKGYGIDVDSDIDVAVFYYDKPEKDRLCDFLSDFAFYRKEFESVRKADLNSGRDFEIDANPGNFRLEDWFNITSAENGPITEISMKNIVGFAEIFEILSYPIINSENKDAFIKMDEIVDAMKKAVANASIEDKATLLQRLFKGMRRRFKAEFYKYSERKKSSVSEDKYIEARMQMLKQRLASKFGLFVEEAKETGK